MKKRINLVGVYLIGILFVAWATILCCTSCNNIPQFTTANDDTKEYVDSLVKESVQNYVNPVFYTVDEVLLFKAKEVKADEIDKIFENLPEDVIQNIATVCINKDGRVTKRGIVYEYRANSEVYNNLGNSTQQSNNTNNTGSMEGNLITKVDTTIAPKGETRITQHDTVINGKKYKVRTKTETEYE